MRTIPRFFFLLSLVTLFVLSGCESLENFNDAVSDGTGSAFERPDYEDEKGDDAQKALEGK